MIKQLLESEVWVDGNVIKVSRGETEQWRWMTFTCADESVLSLSARTDGTIYELGIHAGADAVVLTTSSEQLASALNIGWDLSHVSEWHMALDLSELVSALVYHDLVGKAHIAYTEDEGLKLRHNRYEREGNVVMRISGKGGR